MPPATMLDTDAPARGDLDGKGAFSGGRSNLGSGNVHVTSIERDALAFPQAPNDVKGLVEPADALAGAEFRKPESLIRGKSDTDQ